LNVTMYSTGCSRCKTLGMMLDKKHISYSVNSDVDEMVNLGLASVPALDVDGELMTYEKAMQWVASQQEGLNEKQ